MLIPVTKKGNPTFVGQASKEQIDASDGKLIPISMEQLSKMLSDINAANAAAPKAPEPEVVKSAAVEPSDISRKPSLKK